MTLNPKSREANANGAPLVSVLMTVFNTAPYLRESIDSIRSQTLQDLELIVVDDCSTDASWAIIEEAASADSRIVAVRRTSQGGASAGLNEGLLLATGAFITRQDGDDVSDPRRLAAQIAFLEGNPSVGAVGTTVRLIDEQGGLRSVWEVPVSNEELQSALFDHMCFCGPTVMASRAAFAAAGLRFNESLSGSEDYDLCLRLAEVTELANLAEPLYLYRQHAASVSRSNEHLQLFRKAVALELALDRRFGRAIPDEQRARVARDYVTAAIMGQARGGATEAPGWVAKGTELNPGVLKDTQWLESTVQKCTPSTVDAGLRFTRSVFDEVLPRTRSLGGLKRRLIARLHIAEVFDWSRRGERARVSQHLWPAIRSNPAWLVNRGVLSLVVREILGGRMIGRLFV